jgi:hypothetical protein
MTHKFAELEEKMSPESRARVGRAVKEALKELPPDLRNACDRWPPTVAPPLQSLAQQEPPQGVPISRRGVLQRKTPEANP